MSTAETGPRPSPGKEWVLVPHPDFPSTALSKICVEAVRDSGTLSLWFWLTGDIDNVRWPELSAVDVRADGLWKETCFEAFVIAEPAKGYSELNFSPSGNWAAYSFDDYRSGMRNMEAGSYGSGYRGAAENGDYGMNFVAIDAFDQTVDWHLNLAAVIEAEDGNKSYWALAHPPGPPDFHNRDCFIATLPAPDAP